MARILRGEIYWADLSPIRGHEQVGRRPVVVISQDVFNERSGTIVAMAITSQTQRAGFPLAHKLSSGGLAKESWVKMSQVRTLSTSRLSECVGRIEPEEMNILIEGLSEIISG
jgi:mRNA interferase MazF